MTAPIPADRYWLMTGDAPAGPFTVFELHAELAAGRATWQTPACPVGGATWLPLVRTPGVGPAADHRSPPPVTVPPTPVSPTPPGRKPGGAGEAVTLVLVLAAVAAGLYGLYEWVRPLTATEVCRRLDTAPTLAEAKRYATLRMHPLLDAIHANPAAFDPNDTFEWTQEVDGPRPRTRLVGFRGSWLYAAAGRRVAVEGHVVAVQDGGWKVDDMVLTYVEGGTLPAPVSLADEALRQPPPRPAGGPARPPVGFWTYLERNWRGVGIVSFFVLSGAWNAYRTRPARRPGGTS